MTDQVHNKSLHVTLIRPPVLELRSNLSSYGAILPIGLAYIAAAARDAGYPVSVIDAAGEALDSYHEIESPIGMIHMNGLTPEEIVDRIPKETNVIGITHMFLHEWPAVKETVERVKAKFPRAVVILGGENATAFWSDIFRETKAVDYCVLGEGEVNVLQLLKCIELGIPVDLQGVMCRPEISGTRHEALLKRLEGANSITYARQAAGQLGGRIRNIDELPRPAWEYFPVEKYMQSADHHGVHRGRSMPMLATRGCPYQCTFCSNPQMWSTRYYTRRPEDVVNEMKRYVERYRINNVNFCDLTAIIKKEWILEFCRLLQKANLKVTWQLPTGTRSEALDDEVLHLVYETGCRNITYAPESGSERMLNLLKKKVHLPKMLESLRAACRAGLVTRVNIIIGHPEEKRSDTWKSLRFLVRCALAGCQDAAVMIFAPYPGSEDTRKLLNHGKVRISEDYYYLALARSGWSSRTYNPFMSTKELIVLQFLMLSVFYAISYLTHPSRIVALLRSLFTGKEQTQMDQLLRTKLRRILKSAKAAPSSSQPVLNRAPQKR